MEEKKRLDYLDVAKGLGMILVVMSHTAEQFRFRTDLVVGFFMPLFFLASGFAYQDKGRSLGKSILRRTKQILVPYFVYSLILYVIWVFRNMHQLQSQQCITALKGILYSRYCMYPLYVQDNTFWLIINNHPLWFLTAMYIASVLSIVALRICKKVKWLYPFFLVLFLYISRMMMMKCPILLPWSLDTAFLGAFFIMAGYLFKKLFDWIGNKHWLKAFLFVPFIIMSVRLSAYNGLPNMSIRDYGSWGESSLYYFAITGVTGSIVFILLSQIIACTILRKPLVQISKASITVLALHPVFLELFDTLVGAKIQREPLSWQYWLYDYVKVAITVCLCVLIKLTCNCLMAQLSSQEQLSKKLEKNSEKPVEVEDKFDYTEKRLAEKAMVSNEEETK